MFDPASTSSDGAPSLAVAVVVGDDDRRHLPRLLRSLHLQADVHVEIFVVDVSLAGIGAVAGARVLRLRTPSRGVALRRAAAAAIEAGYEWIALQHPACEPAPNRLAQALERLRETQASLAVCDYELTDDHGQSTDYVSLAVMGDAPGPFWESGIVVRSEVLARISTAAYAPVELALYGKLIEAAATTRVRATGFSVAQSEYERLWERSREDALLVKLSNEVHPGLPELTVALCTQGGHDGLLTCLESFARQLVPPGTFEIVLVDDGSKDDTEELLDGLELTVPVQARRQSRNGLAAARNACLELARGRYVLFVRDDALAYPDLVQRHLTSHAFAEEAGSVVGSSGQRPDSLHLALPRHLEDSSEFSPHIDLTPGEACAALQCGTGNMSVSVHALRAVGGFDAAFGDADAAVIDLALRLEGLGCKATYEPRARTTDACAMDVARLGERIRDAAAGSVRLARKHPRISESLLRGGGREALPAGAFDRNGRGFQATEDAVRALASIDIEALEALGSPYTEVAADVLDTLAEGLHSLHSQWWSDGVSAALHANGISDLDEVQADGWEIWPFECEAERRLLAWPLWDDQASLERLMERVAPLVGTEFVALVLRYDPLRDPPRERALALLEAAHRRHFEDQDLEVLLEEASLDRGNLIRLGRSVDAFLPLGGEPALFLRAVVAERLETPADVEAWRRRFGVASTLGPRPHHESPVADPQTLPEPAPRVVPKSPIRRAI